MAVEIRFRVKVGDRFLSEEEARNHVVNPASVLHGRDLEGALCIVCDGIEILGEREWDYIEYLTLNILDRLDAIFRGEEVVVSFPDQPLELRFSSVGEMVILSARGPRVAMPRGEALRALYDLCRRFLDFMLKLHPSGNHKLYLSRLAHLLKQFPETFGGAMRHPDILPVLVEVIADVDAGIVDFLIGDALVRVGQPAPVLPLVLAIEPLADGIARLRSGCPVVDIVLGRDVSSLWLSQQKVDGQRCVGLAYREIEAGVVLLDKLDAECGRAVGMVLRKLRECVSQGSVPREIDEAVRRVSKVWPQLR